MFKTTNCQSVGSGSEGERERDKAREKKIFLLKTKSSQRSNPNFIEKATEAQRG